MKWTSDLAWSQNDMTAEWGTQDLIQNCGNWVKFSGDEVEEEWALEQEGEGSDGGHIRFWEASQDQSDDT